MQLICACCDWWSSTALQNGLIFLTLVVTICVSFGLHIKGRDENIKQNLDARLFSLQQLSFEKPFLEETKFTSNWIQLRQKYLSSKSPLTPIEIDKCLQYEVYCEMLFNFIEDSYNFYKDENKMLKYVAFKQWVRTHKSWWQTPLEEHSNHDTYNPKLCVIIENWLK